MWCECISRCFESSPGTEIKREALLLWPLELRWQWFFVISRSRLKISPLSHHSDDNVLRWPDRCYRTPKERSATSRRTKGQAHIRDPLTLRQCWVKWVKIGFDRCHLSSQKGRWATTSVMSSINGRALTLPYLHGKLLFPMRLPLKHPTGVPTQTTEMVPRCMPFGYNILERLWSTL